MVGVTVHIRSGTACRGSTAEGASAQSRGRWKGAEKEDHQSLVLRVPQERHLAHRPSSLPPVSGCFCCKPGSPAGNRCHGGRGDSEQGHLGAGAKEGNRGKVTKPAMVQGSSTGKREWMPHYCRAMGTLRPGAPHTPTKRGHLSFPIPQKAPSSWFCAPTSPNTPYLQLPKGLEGKNLDGPLEARTGDMDELKEKHSGQ